MSFSENLRLLIESGRNSKLLRRWVGDSHLPFIILLALNGVVTHHQWFSNLSMLSYGDWIVDAPEKIIEYFNSPQSWNSNSLGGRDLGGVYWPFLVIAGLLAYLNLSPELIERILFLWPVALLTPIFMYALSFYILKSRLGAITSAIVYSFSTPLVVLSTGIFTSHMAVTITPLLLLTYFIALEKINLRYIFLTALLAFVTGCFDFRFLYLAAWIMIIYTIFHYSIQIRKYEISINLKLILLISTLIAVFVLLNCYWLPNLFQTSFGTGILNRSLFGTSFVDLTKSFFLFVYLWSGSEIVAFQVNPIALTFLPIPIFAVLGIFLSKGDNKYILFFAIICMVGIFLTKMDHEPFSEIYSWLYSKVPGFSAFRDSTKFYFYISLGYAVLIGGFVTYYAALPMSHYWKKVARLLLIVFVNAIFLWNALPLVTGEVKTVYIPRSTPEDYLILNNFLKYQKEFFRTLYIPRESHWGHYTNIHPKMSAVDLSNGSWESYALPGKSESRRILSMFQQSFSSNLISYSAVKYLVVPVKDSKNDDDFFQYYGKGRNEYIRTLDKLPYLEKINIGTRELVIYENKYFRPHIYATSEIETLNKIYSYNKVKYECMQPTQCEVQLNNLTSSVYLNFSESFDPEWRLIVGKVSWPGPSDGDVLPTSFHLNSEAKLNSFYVDIDYIKEHYPDRVKSNSDGSISLDMTLYFMPQKAIGMGSLIALVTLIGLVSFLIFEVFVKIKSGKYRYFNFT